MPSPNSRPDRKPDPDLYAAMLLAVRAWLRRNHPDSRYAAVTVDLGTGLPVLVVPVTRPTSSPSRGRA